MTREERERIKEWRKSVAAYIKEYAKAFKVKKRSDAVWYTKDGMFYYMYLHELAFNNSPHIDITIMAKPLWLDDIYWTIERSFRDWITKPKGVHSDYDWSVKGLIRRKETINAADFSETETDKMVKTAFEIFTGIPEISERDFLKAVESGEYENPIGQIITAICYRDYMTARRLAQEKVDANVISTFYQRAIDYLDFGDVNQNYQLTI